MVLQHANPMAWIKGRNQVQEMSLGTFPFERGEMVMDSAFGETPLLKLKESQPLLMTHELVKRKIENIGYTNLKHSGPFSIRNSGTSSAVIDGWEQVGGYFKADKYGVYVSQDILDLLKGFSLLLAVVNVILLFTGAWFYEEGIILAVVALIANLGVFVPYAILMAKRNASKITLKLIYQGFRPSSEKPQLGEELLGAMLDAVKEYKLEPVSNFLEGVGQFSITYSKELKLISCYSLDTSSKNSQSVVMNDINALDKIIPESLGDSSTSFTAPPSKPSRLMTEIQINKKRSSFNTSVRFPLNAHAVGSDDDEISNSSTNLQPPALERAQMPPPVLDEPQTNSLEQLNTTFNPSNTQNPSQITIYKKISGLGHDIGTFEEFTLKMQSEQSRWDFYNIAKQKGMPIGEWHDFNSKMSNADAK